MTDAMHSASKPLQVPATFAQWRHLRDLRCRPVLSTVQVPTSTHAVLFDGTAFNAFRLFPNALWLDICRKHRH
ncbi:hypothetical protein A0H81_12094 [Grifola frondosa]|uniref:Uncharacterized protein n=1 Tax=Grifola frondosa TaxID=5627 RepID=A0A1C7LSC8_GRIFR|nr:hypothetical protein A0H81_12094 [Grifola frondosa]